MEDVVVDPPRHKEYEGAQRQRRVGAGEAKDMTKYQRARSQRGTERKDNERTTKEPQSRSRSAGPTGRAATASG
jgi:hypothetical protein